LPRKLREEKGKTRKAEKEKKGRTGKGFPRRKRTEKNRVYMDHAGVNRHSVKTENRNASMNTKLENIMGGEKGENLITKRELACRLKRTVRTITNWQRRGIIPYVRWRHAVYFDWHAVQASLQPRQGLLDFAPADACRAVASERRPASPRLAESEIPALQGPVRLPVYQMRDETKAGRKCRQKTKRL